jgi:hypothetical protein
MALIGQFRHQRAIRSRPTDYADDGMPVAAGDEGRELHRQRDVRLARALKLLEFNGECYWSGVHRSLDVLAGRPSSEISDAKTSISSFEILGALRDYEDADAAVKRVESSSGVRFPDAQSPHLFRVAALSIEGQVVDHLNAAIRDLAANLSVDALSRFNQVHIDQRRAEGLRSSDAGAVLEQQLAFPQRIAKAEFSSVALSAATLIGGAAARPFVEAVDALSSGELFSFLEVLELSEIETLKSLQAAGFRFLQADPTPTSSSLRLLKRGPEIEQ